MGRGAGSREPHSAQDNWSWDACKSSGLPALFVMLPALLWMAMTAAVLQAGCLLLFVAGMKKEYYYISQQIYALTHRPLFYLFEYSGSKVILHMPREKAEMKSRLGTDQSLLLCNHRGNVDWLVGIFLSDFGGGIGSCKAMLKRELLAVPFIGFIWWACDFIALRRNWSSDAKTLEQGYKQQHIHKELGVPYTLCIFPEGTRMTPKKLEDSQAFAKQRGIREPTNVLCPRTKGVWSAVNGLQLDVIFDATVVAKTGAEANVITLAQGKPVEMHIHLDVIPAGEVPRGEEEIGKWLFQRWEAKDKLLTTFLKEGTFEGSSATDGGSSKGQLVVREVCARDSVYHAMLATVLWWWTCVASFAYWCVHNGRMRLMFGVGFGFLVVVGLLGVVLYLVHFKKSDPKDAKKKKQH